MISVTEAGVEIAGRLIPWEAFPELVRAHLTRCPDTEAAERAGHRFLKDPSEANAMDLVVRTLYWGGSNGPRILPGVKSNSRAHIRDSLAKAAHELNRGHELIEISEALRQVNEIKYLGQVSFASKVLRMLEGQWVGVLDSVVGSAAGYRLDRPRFALYSVQLQEIARELEKRCVSNPRGREGWWASDCDQAIFAFLRGWSTSYPAIHAPVPQPGAPLLPPPPPPTLVGTFESPELRMPYGEGSSLHNVLVRELLGREGQVVPTREIVGIGVAAGFRASGVQPGDHALGGGAPTCACAANGRHIFINDQPRGWWRVADNLYWREGGRATP